MQSDPVLAAAFAGEAIGIDWLLRSIWVGCAVVVLLVGISILRQSLRGREKRRHR